MRPTVRGITMDIVNRQAPLFFYKKSTKNEQWSVMRGALGKGGGRWLPVRDLDAYVGEVFRSVAAQQGVKLPRANVSKSLPAGTVVAQEVSGGYCAKNVEIFDQSNGGNCWYGGDKNAAWYGGAIG